MSSKGYGKEEVEELIAIGKQVKLAYPGEFNIDSDFVVGEVAIRKGLWPIKDAPKSKPTFFVGTRTNHIEKVTKYKVAKVTQDWQIEAAIRRAEADAAMTPRRIAQEIFKEEQEFYLQSQTNDTLLRTDQLNKGLVARAVEEGVDVATFNQMQLEREKQRLEIEKTKELAEHASTLKITEHEEMGKTDLQIEHKKARLKIAALKMAKRVEMKLEEQRGRVGKNNAGKVSGRVEPDTDS